VVIMKVVIADNLLSGLMGAILGLVGAVVIAWHDRRQEGRAAARAVFLEVAANSAALVLAAKHGVYATVTSATWDG
jgi:ABC-type lipoprotein release transport system permease subunit